MDGNVRIGEEVAYNPILTAATNQHAAMNVDEQVVLNERIADEVVKVNSGRAIASHAHDLAEQIASNDITARGPIPLNVDCPDVARLIGSAPDPVQLHDVIVA